MVDRSRLFEVPSDSSESLSKASIGLVWCLVGILIGLLIGFFICYLDIQRIKRDAVEAGVADFVVDKTGSVDFVWKVIQ